MGTQAVTSPITNESMKKRALELQAAYANIGNDFSAPVKHTDKNGAIFTFTKDPTTGNIKCSYEYHNIKQNDILLFERNSVATGNAGLAYISNEQLDEYKRNHPESYVTTEYAAAEEAVKLKQQYERQLNHYDKDVRNNARQNYEDLVANEIFKSGTVDFDTAKKMAKYARKDAQAGQKAAKTTVYLDKDEYKKALKTLKADKKAAEKQIKEAQKRGFLAPEHALLKMEEEVQYIDDKEVREYIENNKDLFFENGKFSSNKYHQWIQSHLQGDNTLTTDERRPASQVTELSEKDMKHAARDGNYRTQNDPTFYINLAKTAAGIAAPLVLAYMNNHNIHEVSKLHDMIETYAQSPDPEKYNEFISAISKAEAIAEVTANFRNVAVRNAFFGALGPALASLIDPSKARDKKSETNTSATIVTQNIFRGCEVTDIKGEVTVEGEAPCEDDDCNASIKRVPTDPTSTPENVVYEKSYFKETKELSYWYDFVQAYNFDAKSYSIKDIYRAIQKRNGYTNERPNPPTNVMLPLELHDAQGNVIATRKDQYTIPRHKIPQGKGNGKGNAPGGTPGISQVPGSNKYVVYDCDGNVVSEYNDEASAKAKYKDITGKDYAGTVK